MSYSRFGDLPSGFATNGVLADPNANFFRKDPQIPDSLVISQTTFIDKADYTPTATGTEIASPYSAYYLYEEAVTDIGGGIFRVVGKYAKVPDTWYSFETLNIPYTKFLGISLLSAGSIIINTSYLFNFLNVQSIEDVKFFNEDGFTDSEQKNGTINVACRVKHEYVLVPAANVFDGNIADSVISFEVSTAANVFSDGKLNCGYIQRNGDPQSNVNIDNESTFSFSNAQPSSKVQIASGVYAGNIYYKHTFNIVRDVVV